MQNLGVRTPALRHLTMHLASWRSLCNVSFWSNSFTRYFFGTLSLTIVGRPRNVVAKTLPSAPWPISSICVSLTSRRFILIFELVKSADLIKRLTFPQQSRLQWHSRHHNRPNYAVDEACYIYQLIPLFGVGMLIWFDNVRMSTYLLIVRTILSSAPSLHPLMAGSQEFQISITAKLLLRLI